MDLARFEQKWWPLSKWGCHFTIIMHIKIRMAISSVFCKLFMQNIFLNWTRFWARCKKLEEYIWLSNFLLDRTRDTLLCMQICVTLKGYYWILFLYAEVEWEECTLHIKMRIMQILRRHTNDLISLSTSCTFLELRPLPCENISHSSWDHVLVLVLAQVLAISSFRVANF